MSAEQFEEYKLKAEEGDREAQYFVGHCLEQGKGVKMDRSKACSWYKSAADQGSGKAMHGLAYCHFFGAGVKQDKDQAKVLWQQSIAVMEKEAQEEKNLESMFVLASAFLFGRGIPEQDTAKARAKARHWFRHAADAGHVWSQLTLANFYRYGMYGTEQDYVQSLSWYQKAAGQDKSSNSATARLKMDKFTKEISTKQEDLRKNVTTLLKKSENNAAVWSRALIKLAKEQGTVASAPMYQLLVKLILLIQVKMPNKKRPAAALKECEGGMKPDGGHKKLAMA